MGAFVVDRVADDEATTSTTSTTSTTTSTTSTTSTTVPETTTTVAVVPAVANAGVDVAVDIGVRPSNSPRST